MCSSQDYSGKCTEVLIRIPNSQTVYSLQVAKHWHPVLNSNLSTLTHMRMLRTPHTYPAGIDGGLSSLRTTNTGKKTPKNQRRNPQERTHCKKWELPLTLKPDGIIKMCKFWPPSVGQYISFSTIQLKWQITSATLITSALFTQHFFLTISVVFPSQTQLDANSALLLLQFPHHDSLGPGAPRNTYN